MSSHATAAIGSSAPLPSSSVDPLVAERTVFSADRTHRFTLFRHWGDPDDYACGISMNPSGAAEDIGDPTVNRMVRRAREVWGVRSEEHTSELQSLMRISYAVFCLKKK